MNYKARYDKLINHFKSQIVEGFVEKHHIIPKCMGGSDEPDNIVVLPARAHFIAHYLLYRAYPDNSNLAHAFAMMGVSNKFQARNSRLYEKSKLARSLALKGSPRPEWVREKLRKPKSRTENYKKPKTREHAEAISKALKGKKKSRESVLASVKSRQASFTARREAAEASKRLYIDLFLSSGLTRKQFYSQHTEYSESTLKRFLRGV